MVPRPISSDLKLGERAQQRPAAGRRQAFRALAKRRATMRRGFVLLMTLVLIVLIGLMAVGIARQSLLLAAEAARRQEELERRWALVSVREAILPRLPELVQKRLQEQAETGELGRPPRIDPTVKFTVKLGQATLTLTVSDEDAKANLNTILAKTEKEGLRRAAVMLTGPSLQPVIRIRPDLGAALDRMLPPFSSWGQVYALERVSSRSSQIEALAAGTSNITLWGQGRLNVWRSCDATLLSIARLALPDAKGEQLLAARLNPAHHTVQDVLRECELTLEEHEDMLDLLSDESTAFSVWVHYGSSRRRWSELHVRHVTEQGALQTNSFSF